jgi:prefoldin subunit 5
MSLDELSASKQLLETQLSELKSARDDVEVKLAEVEESKKSVALQLEVKLASARDRGYFTVWGS